MQKELCIEVADIRKGTASFTVQEMAAMTGEQIALEERVPGVSGEAFGLKAWYRSWRQSEPGQEPTHVRVEAVDEFQAQLPWAEADLAVFLYAQDGEPIKKGYPMRLYVPDGSSECLNVKSIVKVWFLQDASLEAEATYGFKNRVTLSDMKLKK
ncbi:hypothetical protein ABE504_29980 [Paenibacillus oryzisoli]|uniref:hypothetical protein n=1 Tax=Paenibacillus oryzisoli TaxID=1850517 RepID=UPI003D2DD05F